jgi:hypothetical protein
MEVSTQQCKGPTPSLHYHPQLQVLDFLPTETSQDCTLYPVSVHVIVMFLSFAWHTVMVKFYKYNKHVPSQLQSFHILQWDGVIRVTRLWAG